MIKKYKFFVLVLSVLVSIVFSGYAFAVDQESLETLRKISKMDKAEQKKLFDKVEQLERGSIFKQAMEMRAYLLGLGVTADTFSNDKIKIEDFYKNKIIYEGGFLGDRKFEIPKAYISSFSHIIPDKETLSENSSISLFILDQISARRLRNHLQIIILQNLWIVGGIYISVYRGVRKILIL